MDSFQHRMAQIVGNISMPKPPVLMASQKRANEIYQNVMGQYKIQKAQLKPDLTINLVCYFGGMVFDIYRIGANDHFFEIVTKDADEGIHIMTIPVEQISFDIIISKKVGDEPPREIGFHSGTAQEKA